MIHPLEEESGEPGDPSAKPTETTDSWAFWNPLIIATSSYCIITFICCAATFNFDGTFLFACIVAGAFFAITQLTAIYAALGSESYWKRLLITQTCLLFFGLSLIGGASVARDANWNSEFPNAVVFALVGASFGSQLMFVFFRFVGNWRLHLREMPRGPVYSLQDLFALTGYLAISLSILNLVSPGGGVAERFPAFLWTAVVVLIATLVYGVPTLSTSFFTRESGQGCFSQLIIVVSIGFLIVMPFAAMGAQMLVGPLILFLGCCALLTWVPLMQMREKGFVLTRHAIEDAKDQNAKS